MNLDFPLQETVTNWIDKVSGEGAPLDLMIEI